MRGAFWAVWLLAGCRTTHTLEASQQADTELHREVQSGPEHIVMTVEEFGQLCDPRESGSPQSPATTASAVHLGRQQPDGGVAVVRPSLLRRTITVTDRGPSLETLNELSRTQARVNDAFTRQPGGIFSLWWLVGLLPVAAGFLAFRLKPAWLGIAWGALKGLFGRKVS